MHEHDARGLAQRLVTAIQALHVRVQQIYLRDDPSVGLCLAVCINGRDVTAVIGPGTCAYDALAAELVHAALNMPAPDLELRH